MNDKNFIINLEKHQTKDIHDSHINGELTVIWRDWDNIIKNHPKMIYVNSINPGEIKGPHIHTKRNSHFLCIHGKVIFVIKHENKYLEIESDEKNPVLVQIPKNFASAHINPTNEPASVLALANPAWKPNDDEMKNVSFDDYDWQKWKK